MDVLTQVLALIDEAYDHKAWHGTTLRGSLRRLDPVRAAWRPEPTRHNIWELVVHAAYWKYTVRRRLVGEKRGSFPLKGSNWFERPVACTPGAWAADVALLDDQHRQLREAVAALDARRLTARVPGTDQTFGFLVRGIAAHDLYHAGQIQLLKRLAP